MSGELGHAFAANFQDQIRQLQEQVRQLQQQVQELQAPDLEAPGHYGLSPQLLWSLLGGGLLVVHFLTDWTHHLQDRFASPPASLPRERALPYLRGLLRCYALGSVGAVAVPAVIASVAAYGLWLFPRGFGKVQAATVLAVAAAYGYLNLVAYWRVASAVFAGQGPSELGRALAARDGALAGDEALGARLVWDDGWKWRPEAGPTPG